MKLLTEERISQIIVERLTTVTLWHCKDIAQAQLDQDKADCEKEKE